MIGTTDLTQLGPESKVRHIQRLLVHQHYVAATARNDIALLELDQPVECSDYIQLGCVPDTSLRVSELKSCYIAGWDFANGQSSGKEQDKELLRSDKRLQQQYLLWLF